MKHIKELMKNNRNNLQKLSVGYFFPVMSVLSNIEKASIVQFKLPKTSGGHQGGARGKRTAKGGKALSGAGGFQWIKFLKNMKELKIDSALPPSEQSEFVHALIKYKKLESFTYNIGKEIRE